jgi:hypothetical protein
MIRRLATALAVTLAMLAAAPPLAAHDDIRVIGTVVRFDGTKLVIKAANGKQTAVKVDKQTQITRDGKKVTRTEVRSGRDVVVDAYGDTAEDALAIEIRLVPPVQNRK